MDQGPLRALIPQIMELTGTAPELSILTSIGKLLLSLMHHFCIWCTVQLVTHHVVKTCTSVNLLKKKWLPVINHLLRTRL